MKRNNWTVFLVQLYNFADNFSKPENKIGWGLVLQQQIHVHTGSTLPKVALILFENASVGMDSIPIWNNNPGKVKKIQMILALRGFIAPLLLSGGKRWIFHHVGLNFFRISGYFEQPVKSC